MGLSCDCDYGDDYDWYYDIEDVERIACTDFECYGCCTPKSNGEHVRLIWSFEFDEDGNESNYEVIGHICEECSGLYDSLNELGFCMTADWGFIRDAMRDYREEYLPRKL